MNFTELSELWLKDKKTEIKKGTYETYCYIVRKIIQGKIGCLTLRKITQKEIDDFMISLQTDKRPKTQKNLSKDLIIKTYEVIRRILCFGQKSKYYKNKIPNFKKIKQNESIQEKIMTFEEDECKKLINYCLQNRNNYTLGILFGLFQGLRIGEICGLKWDDIDLIHNKITIRRTVRCSVNPDTLKEEWIIGSPKTNTSFRTIPLNNHIIKILKTFSESERKGFLIKQQKIYLKDFDLPCRPANLRNYFYKCLKELKIPQKKFHCLRHTFASTAIRKCVSPKTLSEILGHSDVKITLNLYVHPSFEEKEKCVNIF